jgi:hypothetical protein
MCKPFGYTALLERKYQLSPEQSLENTIQQTELLLPELSISTARFAYPLYDSLKFQVFSDRKSILSLLITKKMINERRSGDLLILEKLADIQTNLALNTQETKRIADAQVKTNGKVAAHEVRQQTLEANQAVIATNLTKIQDREDKKDSNKSDWVTYFLKWFIGIGGALFYYLLIRNGFPHFLN